MGITIKEAAKIFGVEPRTIWYHAKNMGIGTRIGWQIFLSESDIEQLKGVAGTGRGYFGKGRKRNAKKYEVK